MTLGMMRGAATMALLAGAFGAGAVAGAAALFAAGRLRRGGSGSGSTPWSAGAHQADGTDSSAQFEAGIADEGMVPPAGTGFGSAEGHPS